MVLLVLGVCIKTAKAFQPVVDKTSPPRAGVAMFMTALLRRLRGVIFKTHME